MSAMKTGEIRPLEAVSLRREFDNWSHSMTFEKVWSHAAQHIGLCGLKPDDVAKFDSVARGVQSHAEVKHEPLANRLLRAHRSTVRNGQLYWASSDMTALATSAARSLPEIAPVAADLPSRQGVLVCANPFAYAPEGGDPGRAAEIAITWSVEAPSAADTLTGFAVTIANEAIASGHRLTPDGGGEVLYVGVIGDMGRSQFDDDQQRRSMRRIGGSQWQHHDEFVVPLGVEYKASGAYDNGTPRPVALLMAMMALLDSPGVASNSEWSPSRSERAKAKRARIGDLDSVRVIDVRRRNVHGPATTGVDVEYRHRWMVDGHWRNQWYPSQNRHKPIWINPYIKGPDGAPMLTGEKVKAIR